MSPNGSIDRDVMVSTGLEDVVAQAGLNFKPQKTLAIDFNDDNMDDRERVIAALEQSGWVRSTEHDWPGNVRELANRLERAAIMSPNGSIDRDVMVSTGLEDVVAQAGLNFKPQKTVAIDFNDDNMDDRERVIAALEQSGWVQAKAARLLNMTPRQIAYRILTLDITMKQI